jgi:ribosomal protein S18 acetylase RimI-like enzyme
MTDDIVFRRYQPADAESVLRLHERALRNDGAFTEGAPDADLRAPLEAYVEAGGEFLVGERVGAIVAMGAYRPAHEWIVDAVGDVAEPAAELKRMRVDPAHQRQGLGTAVLDRLEASAREDGYREFLLDTGVDQAGTRAFYEARGFTQVGVTTVDFGGDIVELALYRKQIDG